MSTEDMLFWVQSSLKYRIETFLTWTLECFQVSTIQECHQRSSLETSL